MAKKQKNELFIPLILATGRKERKSEGVAKFVFEEVKARGFESELIDVRTFALSETDNTKTSETAKKFAGVITRADGLIIVSPEYNHGYPGELKMALDQLYEEYNRKPIGICGVSAGVLGGARMVEQLRLVAIEFQMVPIRNAVYFSESYKLFDDEGNLKDAEYYHKRLNAFFDELAWYAKALKKARNKSIKG